MKQHCSVISMQCVSVAYIVLEYCTHGVRELQYLCLFHVFFFVSSVRLNNNFLQKKRIPNISSRALNSNSGIFYFHISLSMSLSLCVLKVSIVFFLHTACRNAPQGFFHLFLPLASNFCSRNLSQFVFIFFWIIMKTTSSLIIIKIIMNITVYACCDYVKHIFSLSCWRKVAVAQLSALSHVGSPN